MAEKTFDTTKSLEHCAKLKEEVLSKITTIEENYNKTNNEILASVLNKFYETDEYTADSVVGEFAEEDKLDYINTFSYGDEKVQKKIKANFEKYQKEKEKIKKHIIGILNLKGKIYNLNEQMIEELENEITSRKKQSCKINEEITTTEQQISDMEQELTDCDAEYENIMSNELENVTLELDECNASLSKPDDLDPRVRFDLEQKRKVLQKSQSELLSRANNINNTRTMLVQNIMESKSKLNTLKIDLLNLNIDSFKEKVAKAKEGNEQLKESIEQDREDYAAAGFDISEQDIIDSTTSPTKSDSPEEKDKPDTKDKSTADTKPQQKGSTQPQTVTQGSPVKAQQDCLPVAQTPEQRAKVMHDKILGGSEDEVRNLLNTTSYSNVLATLENCSKKDKKNLLSKLGSLNSPLDVARLSNVVSALQKSGMCSPFDINNLITDTGKLQDFSRLSDSDIDSLNRFINEIQSNKKFIDDEQLDFLQNGFINNVRCNSLAQSLQPRRFRDFFKSKSARERDQIRGAKFGTLSTSIATIPPKETDTPTHSDNFFNVLTSGTRENSEIVTTPPKREGPDRSTR